MSEANLKRENPVRLFFRDRLVLILIVLFIIFIWPTPFETRESVTGVDRVSVTKHERVWRFSGTPAPWSDDDQQ